MPRGETLQVKGYRELLRALAVAEAQQKREVRETLRHVGDVVRADAAARIAGKSPRSAAGLRTRVRQRGIAVAQSIRKTTGFHSEWGAWQMRHALLPALGAAHLTREMEQALDRMAARFNRGGAA